MSDQIIDALMACAIHADAARTHPLVGWVVMRDQPDYPDEMIARLVTNTPRPTSCEATRWLKCRPNCRPAWSEPNASRLPARGSGDLVSWVAGSCDQVGLNSTDSAPPWRAFPGWAAAS
jgi:hypothetical protein